MDLFSFSLPAIEWTSRLWASMTFFPFPVCLSHNGRCSDVRPDGLRFSDSANQAIPNHFMATPMAHQYPSPCCRGCFPRSYRRKTADAAIWNEVRFHCRRDIAYLDFHMLTVTVTATTSTRRRANLGHSEAMDYDHVSVTSYLFESSSPGSAFALRLHREPRQFPSPRLPRSRESAILD